MHIQVLCEEFIFVEYFPTYWAWERFADFAMHRSFVSLQIGRIPLSKQKIQYDLNMTNMKTQLSAENHLRIGSVAIIVITSKRFLASVNLRRENGN